MESARVVEVLHDRGEAASPRWLLGSGFVVKSGIVLTAAHNLGDAADECGPHGTVVRSLDGAEYIATPMARSDEVDIAMLHVPDIKARATRIGRVDRDQIDVIRNVSAPGFPNYKYAEERPASSKRQPAQPTGSIPTVEDLSSGELTLKIEAAEPSPASQPGGSPWQGLSGAGVVADELLFGIAVEHRLAEGLGALRVVPLTRLAEVPPPDGALFGVVLGIDDPDQLPVVGGNVEPEEQISTALVADLKQLLNLRELGLLGAAELSTLRITAVKEHKGWRQ